MVDTDSDAALAMRIQQEEFARSALAPRQAMPDNYSAPLLDASNHDDNPLLNGGGVGDDNDNYRNMNDNDMNNLQDNARRARRNAIGTVREADSDSPRILLLRIAIAMVEIIATSTVLAIGWDEGSGTSCDYLKWWVLIFTYRHFVTIPFRILIFRYNRQQQPLSPQQQQPQQPQELLNDDNENIANPENSNDGNLELQPPPPQQQQQQQARSITVAQKSVQILRWLTIASFLLFLVGHTILVTESECKYAAPVVWYYCLVIIIFVWISLSLPFWIVLAICICLPCVLIIFRFFAEPGGANEQTIKDLPTRKITAADLAKHGHDAEATTTEEKVNEQAEPAQAPKEEDDEDDEDDEDAPSCAICMQLYKVDDELRILPCQHEFHCECVDRWLQMNVKCPLCRHDITRQAANHNDNADNNHNNDENV